MKRENLSNRMLKDIFVPFEKRQLPKLPVRASLINFYFDEFHNALNILRTSLHDNLNEKN